MSSRSYGIILSVPRSSDNAVNNIRAVFEDAPDAVTVPPSICDFELTTAEENEIVLAYTRPNTSTAVRFSEPPVSQRARGTLAQAVQLFVPLHPQEGIMPLRVFKLPLEEQLWLADRVGPFVNFRRDPAAAKVRMARVFSVACAALAAINTIDDDRHSRWVTASVPSMNAYPIRLRFRLTNMVTEAGWVAQRPVELWVEGSPTLSRARVFAVQVHSEERELDVTIAACRDTDEELVKSIRTYGRRIGLDVFVPLCVKIGRVPNAANPAIETIARRGVFQDIQLTSTAHDIIDLVYGARSPQWVEPVIAEDQVLYTIRGQEIALTRDQREALALGCSMRPIVAIQAAFGTGKTVLGAIIAARHALIRNQRVVVTANAAVAQFTNSILAIDELRRVEVAETAAQDEAPTTPVDMHKVLLSIAVDRDTPYTNEERAAIPRYSQGRRRYENFYSSIPTLLPLVNESATNL